jgi:hypothetical protein
MKHAIFNKKRDRITAFCVVFAVMFLCLTDCRGCRRKKTATARETQKPAVAVESVDRHAARQRPAPRPANALDKIAAAEKAGKLDLDSAWICKIQALFDQASLPAEYRSPKIIKCGTPVLDDLAVVRDRLKPETLAKLRPYLLRPTDPESFFASRIAARVGRRPEPAVPGRLYAQEVENPQRPSKDRSLGDWVGIGCHSAPITVWSAIGQEAAENAAAVIDRRNFWSRFKKIMPFEPLSDEEAVDAEGKPDKDIDGDLDIYLVPASTVSKDGHFSGVCVGLGTTTRIPSWIMIDQDQQGADLGAVLAHELFHSFQYALDAYEEKWWKEATASWSEEYIDTSWSTDEYVPDAFDVEKFLLKTLNSGEEDQNYAAYIFPSYLAGRFGDDLIGQIWSDCSVDGPNALQSVERQLSGAGLEFKEAWKEFALMNYDDTKDYGRKYKETLNTFGCHWEDRVVLTDKSQAQSIVLPPLSVFYFCVENRGIDPDKFPAVHFGLEDLEKEPDISVQAVIVKGGEHRVEDWTGQKEHDFCLKNESDRFDEIVVVVASSERKRTLEDLIMPVELGYVTECDADWVGTLTFAANYNCDESKEGEWRKTGAWRSGTSGPWEDQFTRHDTVQKNSFRATATVNLALKAQASKAESEEEKELLEGMNRLFGGAVYIQEGVRGTCGISIHKYSKETTNIRPPGTSYFVSSDSKASGGGMLTKYGMSALSGPRLTVYPEKGEYTLEIDFSAPDVPGSTTIESSGGGSDTNHWTWDGGKPLFSSYEWRTSWAEPALKGKYDGKAIQGTWKSPPRKKPKEGTCPSALLENAEITVSWSLTKMK